MKIHIILRMILWFLVPFLSDRRKGISWGLTQKCPKNQEAFQKTQYFKERFKTRYMIEAKNSELKNIHGYSRCDAAGLSNMQLQGAVSIFAVNLKRILKLKGEVCPNEKK